MKVALIHDWLTGMRGGEKCLDAFLSIYPDADIFTLIHKKGVTTPEIDSRVMGTSWLNNVPAISSLHRLFLPLYPSAIRSINLSRYDMVVSLSHAAAKNVVVPSGVRHICYCFTPMRYIWDQADQYFGGVRFLLWPIINNLRLWDRSGAQGVTDFVAISRFIAARIRCYYGRSSKIVYPPVETDWIKPAVEGERGEALLYAGALVPYKRPDLVVAAANKLRLPLWVVGGGPLEKQLRRLAGPTVEIIGRCSDSDLANYYRRCRALILPGVEDFGMMPVECMAAGRPVIGRRFGGTADTVVVSGKDRTGVYIEGNRRTIKLDDLVVAINRFAMIEESISVSACVQQASRFSKAAFMTSWRSIVEDT